MSPTQRPAQSGHSANAISLFFSVGEGGTQISSLMKHQDSYPMLSPQSLALLSFLFFFFLCLILRSNAEIQCSLYVPNDPLTDWTRGPTSSCLFLPPPPFATFLFLSSPFPTPSLLQLTFPSLFPFSPPFLFPVDHCSLSSTVCPALPGRQPNGPSLKEDRSSESSFR